MEGLATDGAGAPVIERVSAKIAALERRADYLDRQIAERRGNDKSLDFAKAEVSALRGAISALRYHRAEVEGLDQPLLVLQELVDVHSPGPDGWSADQMERAAEAWVRARKLLEEWTG